MAPTATPAASLANQQDPYAKYGGSVSVDPYAKYGGAAIAQPPAQAQASQPSEASGIRWRKGARDDRGRAAGLEAAQKASRDMKIGLKATAAVVGGNSSRKCLLPRLDGSAHAALTGLGCRRWNSGGAIGCHG